MTRARPMTRAERAALADALRHMQQAGIRPRDMQMAAGTKLTRLYDKVRMAPVRSPA